MEEGRGTDIYVCMGAQSQATARVGKNGKTYYAAFRRRENAVFLKSLYIDVDVKPDNLEKGYADQAEAVREFNRIYTGMGLPPPSIAIASGSGGFHAHWVLTEAISYADWQPLAQALVNGFVAGGFRGDTGCSIDPSRLLRVPNTFNFKNGARNPVTIFDDSRADYLVDVLRSALSVYIGSAAPQPVRGNARTILGPLPTNLNLSKIDPNALGAGIVTGNDPVPIAELSKVCPWIEATLKDGGAKNANPLWLASTNVSLFTPEGRDAAHWMAQGHISYNVAETDALYQRQLDVKQQRDLGWPQCRSIYNQGAPQCKTCPHLALNKSPFNLVPMGITAHVPTLQTLAVQLSLQVPAPYVVDAGGYVCKVVTVDEGATQKNVPLCKFTFDKPWLQDEPPMLNFSTEINRKIRQIKVPYQEIHDNATLGKRLSSQGMQVQKHHLNDLSGFMTSWIEELSRTRDNIVHNAPFGWSVKDGKVDGFVYAGHIWSKGVPRPASNPDPILAAQYLPTGDLEPWRAAAAMITDQARPALDAMLAASFAAPLVRFTGQTGLLLSTYSQESGIGKSTAMKAAQSVWGHPIKAVQSLSDTQNSVIKKIGDIKNLPMFWDELKTDEDTRRFVNLAFQLAQGKEKSRLGSDTSYRDTGTWQTTLVATSNDSLVHFVMQATKTTAAGVYRIFEYVVPPGVTGQISSATAQQITAKLNDNYGNAGLLYAQFLGEHHEAVAVYVDNLMHELEKAHNIKPDERFWAAMVTTIIAGAHYSNQLGLTSINEAALREFMLARFEDMRGLRREAPVDVANALNVLSMLAKYLNAKKRRNSITTSHIHTAAGRPPAGSVRILSDMSKVDDIQVQYGRDDYLLRFRKVAFDDWLTEQHLSHTIVLSELMDKFGIRQFRGKLAAATPFVTATDVILEFSYRDPVFQDFIEVW